MLAGRAPDRAQAARLLGVSPDADPTEVKRAFRLWAVWAHPDQGGSADRFTDLCAARDLLLEPRTTARPPGSRSADASGPSHDGVPTEPRPRKGWRQVLVHPSPLTVGLLAMAYIGAVAAVLVAGPSPLLAVPAALASAAWCVAVSRAILRGGDHGHRHSIACLGRCDCRAGGTCRDRRHPPHRGAAAPRTALRRRDCRGQSRGRSVERRARLTCVSLTTCS